MGRRSSDVVANADVHLLDTKLGLRCVHKHLTVDRHLICSEFENVSSFHRECAETALRVRQIDVTTEPEMRNLVKNDLSETSVARGLSAMPIQIAATNNDVGFIEHQRSYEPRNVIGVVLSISIKND